MLLCNTKMENTKNSHISDQNLLKLNLDTYNSYFVFQTKKRQKMFNDVLLELLLILDSRFQYGHLHLECGNWYSIFGLPTLTQHRGWLLAQKKHQSEHAASSFNVILSKSTHLTRRFIRNAEKNFIPLLEKSVLSLLYSGPEFTVGFQFRILQAPNNAFAFLDPH